MLKKNRRRNLSDFTINIRAGLAPTLISPNQVLVNRKGLHHIDRKMLKNVVLLGIYLRLIFVYQCRFYPKGTFLGLVISNRCKLAQKLSLSNFLARLDFQAMQIKVDDLISSI